MHSSKRRISLLKLHRGTQELSKKRGIYCKLRNHLPAIDILGFEAIQIFCTIYPHGLPDTKITALDTSSRHCNITMQRTGDQPVHHRFFLISLRIFDPMRSMLAGMVPFISSTHRSRCAKLNATSPPPVPLAPLPPGARTVQQNS